jgi:hypothetical protein
MRKIPFSRGHTDFVRVHRKVVRNRVLTNMFVNNITSHQQAKTYLDDLEKFLWAIDTSNR